MVFAVRVKTGAHRDGLWREGEGLYAQIRAAPTKGEANAYLVKFLAGSLRLSRSLVKITQGQTSSHKRISVDVPNADLQPILDSIPVLPQATLFD